MKKSRSLYVSIFGLIAFFLLASSNPLFRADLAAESGIIPDTPRGKVMSAWFEAFNSGDAGKMGRFQEDNFSERLLTRFDSAARESMYKGIYADAAPLEPAALSADTPERISVIARSGSGEWLEVGMVFEEGTGRIDGIRLQPSGPPDQLPPPGSLSGSAAYDSIGSALDRLAARDEFSGTVLIARDGRPVFHEAYGLASREFAVPNRTDTKFNLGSINKLFTKVAISQLVENGKLSLDERLGDLIPDYPNRDAAKKVTVRHLVSMTSGIGDFFNEKYVEIPKDRLRANEDYLQLFAGDDLEFEPGEEYRYSNGGYVVLGVIIGKVSGMSYYDYVRKNIFEPAGMKDADSYEADAIVENLATGYTRQRFYGETGPIRSNIYTRPARGSSAGGGYSTAADLLAFFNALQSGKLLPAEYADWVLGGPEPGTAAGRGTHASGRDAAFAGGAPGINAFVRTGITGGYTVITMTNLDPPTAMQAGRMIGRWLEKIE